jgi:hypothetical protein
VNIREGVRISRRYQLRLREPLSSELEAFARGRDLGVCPAIQLLLRQALDAESSRAAAAGSPAALAALLAAEHTLLVVASILPQGRSLIAGLAAEAAAAAEERLALFSPEGER